MNRFSNNDILVLSNREVNFVLQFAWFTAAPFAAVGC